MVALSGAHTIGQSRCAAFRARLHGNGSAIEANFATTRRCSCPFSRGEGDQIMVPLDLVTPNSFDNNYFRNLVQRRVNLPTVSSSPLGKQNGIFLFHGINRSLIYMYSVNRMQAALKAVSCKVTKHEKACIENQHVFILFAFDTFGFLATEAVDLLKRVQRVMHSNVMTPKSMDVVFKRVSFAIQKGVAAQLVARLPSTSM
ncbi:hypothetical protein LXL04_010126 [Taraxacum kok-saghyz]